MILPVRSGREVAHACSHQWKREVSSVLFLSCFDKEMARRGIAALGQ